ncbi:hypothetical protein J2W36_004798 [Variovorax ginsengisoli]|uniref:Uncharacterized protein n=1 Tax=Variovorax ginsengisoli TaxID=363844 RepID=A0ABT9SFG2_9BURK|nr:hypothetical protein [Variovorax ginsengisoli]
MHSQNSPTATLGQRVVMVIGPIAGLRPGIGPRG